MKTRTFYIAAALLLCGSGIPQNDASPQALTRIEVADCCGGHRNHWLDQVDAIKKLYPAFARLGDPAGDLCTVYGAGDQVVGRLLLESRPEHRTVAFADTIEIALALDANDRIIGILYGEHQETPAYLDYVREDEFNQSWNGLTLPQAALHEVDVVTGATYTSRAIRADVRHIAARHALGETPAEASCAPANSATFATSVTSAPPADAAAPVAVKPDVSAMAAAHRSYDFEEDEELAEFSEVRKLLEQGGSADRIAELLLANVNRDIRVTADRLTYFAAKLAVAEASVAGWQQDPEGQIEAHLKGVLASHGQMGHGHGAPSGDADTLRRQIRRPMHNSQTLEAERRFRAAAANYRASEDPALLAALRNDIAAELKRRREGEAPLRIVEYRRAVENTTARLQYLKSDPQAIAAARAARLIALVQAK